MEVFKDIDVVRYKYYKARMLNDDWKPQTVKNLFAQLKKDELFEDYLAARCAYEFYKVEKLRKGCV